MKHKDEWAQLMEHLRQLPQSHAGSAPLRLPNYLLIGAQEKRMHLKKTGHIRYVADGH